jgi:hypothetical protein
MRFFIRLLLVLRYFNRDLLVVFSCAPSTANERLPQSDHIKHQNRDNLTRTGVGLAALRTAGLLAPHPAGLGRLPRPSAVGYRFCRFIVSSSGSHREKSVIIREK